MSDSIKECFKLGFISLFLSMFLGVLGITLLLDIILYDGIVSLITIVIKIIVFALLMKYNLSTYRKHKELFLQEEENIKSLSK